MLFYSVQHLIKIIVAIIIHFAQDQLDGEIHKIFQQLQSESVSEQGKEEAATNAGAGKIP